MIEQAQTFSLWLCLLGLLGWIPLMITFGLIGMLRKIIALVETWM